MFRVSLGETYPAFTTFQKLPPSPVYFLFYGGLGLLIAAFLALVENRGRGARLLRVAGMIGQNSLLVFVVQYFMYFSVVKLLDLPLSPWWPLYFAATLLPIFFAAKLWHAAKGNRFFTVRYPALHRRVMTRRTSPDLA